MGSYIESTKIETTKIGQELEHNPIEVQSSWGYLIPISKGARASKKTLTRLIKNIWGSGG